MGLLSRLGGAVKEGARNGAVKGLLKASGNSAATGKLNYALPVKLYSDAYVQVAIGSGQNPNITARVKGGEEYLIRCPLNNLNNTTFYMFTPQLYTEIGTNDDDEASHYKGNLGGFGIAQYNFSHCEKLQKHLHKI